MHYIYEEGMCSKIAKRYQSLTVSIMKFVQGVYLSIYQRVYRHKLLMHMNHYGHSNIHRLYFLSPRLVYTYIETDASRSSYTKL